MQSVNDDILNYTTGIIVHGCNAQGRFNKGLTKAIREKYPRVYMDYMYHFHTSRAKLGDIIVTRVSHNLYIVSAIIQNRFGNNPNVVYVNYDGLRECFRKVNDKFGSFNLPILFPSIGAGLANGNWTIIEKIIQEELDGQELIHVVRE